jgi:hypothetical protein
MQPRNQTKNALDSHAAALPVALTCIMDEVAALIDPERSSEGHAAL